MSFINSFIGVRSVQEYSTRLVLIVEHMFS